MEKDLVEIIDVWSPVESGGTAISFPDGKNLKLIARFANGVPLILEKEFYSEKRYITQEEYKHYKTN